MFAGCVRQYCYSRETKYCPHDDPADFAYVIQVKENVRALKREQHPEGTRLVGLHAQNPKKGTDKPTTERLLKAFSGINLTIIQFPDRVVHHVTPLSPLQTLILTLLGLSPDIYRALAHNSS